MIPKEVIIKSGDHYEGLVFVKSSDYTSQFSVTMHELHDNKNKIVFNVHLD